MSNEMTCSPHCPYFPQVDTNDWVYDVETGLKVRKKKREFICGYDGHVITNWYSECPDKCKKKDED